MNLKLEKVRMLKTKTGFFSNSMAYRFKAGKVFNIKRSLARQFIDNGTAELYVEDDVSAEEKTLKKNIIPKKSVKQR